MLDEPCLGQRSVLNTSTTDPERRRCLLGSDSVPDRTRGWAEKFKICLDSRRFCDSAVKAKVENVYDYDVHDGKLVVGRNDVHKDCLNKPCDGMNGHIFLHEPP